MRTTLTIDDDVMARVKSYAKNHGITLGQAITELVRRGLHAPLRTRVISSFHVVDLPPDSPGITAEHVREIENDLK